MARRIVCVLMVSALSVGASSSARSASAGWKITDLGTLGGKESEAFAINSAGQVAGWSDGRGFVRLRSRLIPIGSLANAINDRGQVAGYSFEGDRQRAFLWTAGALRMLPTPAGECPASMPAALNARGHVVGWAGQLEDCSLSLSLARSAALWRGTGRSELAEADSHAVGVNERGDVIGNREGGAAFIRRGGRLIGLGALSKAGSSSATAINERGQIAGSSETPDLTRRAFLWEGGRMRSLGTLGGRESWVSGEGRRGDLNFATFYPDALNERGQIVGTSMTAGGNPHLFIWAKGRMKDLGTLGGKTSYALAINERGQVIGHSALVSGVDHAFVWQNGRLVDLGTLGGKTSYAAGINDRGQIVGAAEIRSGRLHAVLWTPSP